LSIRTIIFDFGNVIGFFDHSRTLKQLVAYTHMNEQQLRSVYYRADMEDAYEKGLMSTETFIQECLRLGHLRCDADTFKRAFQDIFSPNTALCELIPRLAKKYQLILASNTNEAHYEKFRASFAPILDLFHALGTSHTLGARKPKREFYEGIQSLTDSAPSECLFLDDILENVEGGRRQGWHTIHYQNHESAIAQMKSFGVHWE
jgi:putative hydrolase of the HAD superfamily